MFHFIVYLFFISLSPSLCAQGEDADDTLASPPRAPHRIIPEATPPGVHEAMRHQRAKRAAGQENDIFDDFTPRRRQVLEKERDALAGLEEYIVQRRDDLHGQVMGPLTPLNPYTVGRRAEEVLGDASKGHFVKSLFPDHPAPIWQAPALIDPAKKDAKGQTNLERMADGHAPLGPDGKRVQLHHTNQTNEGALAEVSGTAHRGNTHRLHYRDVAHWVQYQEKEALAGLKEGINRSAFARLRGAYWRQRAKDLGEKKDA